jgi:hypothetical protein
MKKEGGGNAGLAKACLPFPLAFGFEDSSNLRARTLGVLL